MSKNRNVLSSCNKISMFHGRKSTCKLRAYAGKICKWLRKLHNYILDGVVVETAPFVRL